MGVDINRITLVGTIQHNVFGRVQISRGDQRSGIQLAHNAGGISLDIGDVLGATSEGSFSSIYRGRIEGSWGHGFDSIHNTLQAGVTRGVVETTGSILLLSFC